LAYVYCGQMAGWMKTPLGTEVDLGPGHIVLDGVPAPAKGAHQPLFSAHVYCGHGRPSWLLLSSCQLLSLSITIFTLNKPDSLRITFDSFLTQTKVKVTSVNWNFLVSALGYTTILYTPSWNFR